MNQDFNSTGKDMAAYFKECFPDLPVLAVREETYRGLWNWRQPAEQEKYIYANWADTTNYMGIGFRQVYELVVESFSIEIKEKMQQGENIYWVDGSLEEFYIHQIPHTELINFTCGHLNGDGQTTSQAAFIILQSMVGLEQLNQYNTLWPMWISILR